jgi:OPA family sugar phosphate sensor protein UhpC-like MFS transporter
MIKRIVSFYTALLAGDIIEDQKEIDRKYKRLRWSVFISATIGYSLFYVCRLSLSVVKKPIVDSGILSDSEIGMIGSALFFAYAICKLTN